MANSPVPFSPSNISVKGGNTAIFDEVKFNPKPNPLNDFDQVTYHIKFSVLPDIEGLDKEIIIAESGSTELNITSLVMSNTVSPERNSKNMPAYDIKMEILEFYGFNLMDRIIQATIDLQISNYTKTPFKLEVKFMGRDPKTGKPIDNVFGSDVWGWKVILNDIDTKVSERGCTHTLNMYPIEEEAAKDYLMRVPQSYTVTGQTCGDILTNLFNMMEDDINQDYGGINMVKYHVSAVPYPASAQSPVKSPLDHIVTSDTTLNSSRNPDQATTNVGISISELVDIIFSNSESAVTLANGVGTSGAVNGNKPTKKHTTLCRIYKTVQYGKYIDLYEDYEKTISYILVPFDTVRIINNLDTYQNINDANHTAQRIQYMNFLNHMQKEYDYIFTGENTEVTKFDINVTFNYSVAVQVMLGIMSYSTASTGQAYSDDVSKRNEAAQYNTAMQSWKALVEQENNKGTDGKPIKPLTDDEKKQRDQYKKFIDEHKDSVQRNAQDSEKNSKNRLANVSKDLTNRKKSTYVDDEDFTNAYTQMVNLPVTLRQTPGLKNQVDGIVESHYDTRRAIFAGILDQAYGQQDANLTDLNMEIRGDPFWLGPPGYRGLFADGFNTIGTGKVEVPGFTIPEQTPKEQGWANFSMAENIVVFRYKVPTGFDEKTGAPIIKENNSYTGFYAIHTVNHNFKEGMFTQTIQGTRVPGADVAHTLRGDTISPVPPEPEKEKDIIPPEYPGQHLTREQQEYAKEVQARNEADAKWWGDKWHSFTHLFSSDDKDDNNNTPSDDPRRIGK